jgi:hypothetical protein
MNASRRLFFGIWVTILVGMAFAVVAVRLFAWANDAGSQSLLGRVLQAQDAIPQIAAEPNDLVLFFGSSMVEAGFSPREFDQFIAESGGAATSFNFGFGGLNPLFQDYLSRRIVERFNKEERHLKLAIIEFNPFQATKARRQLGAALEESYISMLATPGELMDITLDDPEKGVRMLEIRYLRDGISAEMITTFFWGEPFRAPPTPPDASLLPDEEADARLDELIPVLNERFEEDYPDFDGSRWYYPWRGGGTIRAERSAETLAMFEEYYSLITGDYRMAADRQQRIDSADIENLDFDPELVEAFLRIVRNFQKIADRVEVVLLPKNTDWIRNPPDALDRQAEVLERISAETGVVVRDWQVLETVTNDMFSDTTHLDRYRGAVALTQHLADQYAGLLRNEKVKSR